MDARGPWTGHLTKPEHEPTVTIERIERAGVTVSGVFKVSVDAAWRARVAGTREFNPLAIVFQPLAWPRQFRFYGPFKAFKHGRPQEVEEMRSQLLEILDRLVPPTKVA